MSSQWTLAAVCVVALTGCGGGSDEQTQTEADEHRESVFDPLTQTIDRAEGVEDTVRAQSEELRRRVEEAEGR